MVDNDENPFGAWTFQGPESDTDQPAVRSVAVSGAAKVTSAPAEFWPGVLDKDQISALYKSYPKP